MEFVVVRRSGNFLCEHVLGEAVILVLHCLLALAEIAERRIWIQCLELARKDSGFRCAARFVENRDQIEHHASIVGLVLVGIRQHPQCVAQVAVTAINDTERVVGADERRIGADRRAGPPIGIVDLAAGERFGRPVVHVHRDDRFLGNGPDRYAAHDLHGKEVDRHCIDLGMPDPDVGLLLSDPQVHMPDEELDVATATPGFLGGHRLEPDRNPKRLCERRRHDHQRKTVAGPVGKGLGGVARCHRVVFELQLALRVERVEESPVEALVLDLDRDFGLHVAFHFFAEREDVALVDALGRRFEQAVIQQFGPRRRWRHGGRRAGSDEEGKQQDAENSHLAFPCPAGSMDNATDEEEKFILCPKGTEKATSRAGPGDFHCFP